MQMRTCRAAGVADMTDDCTSADAFSLCDVDAGEMRIARRQTVAVIDLDKIAVAAHRTCEGDAPRRGGTHQIAIGTVQIDARVQSRAPPERIDARPERRGHLKLAGQRCLQGNMRQDGLKIFRCYESILQVRRGAGKSGAVGKNRQRNEGSAHAARSTAIWRVIANMEAAGRKSNSGQRVADAASYPVGRTLERGEQGEIGRLGALVAGSEIMRQTVRRLRGIVIDWGRIACAERQSCRPAAVLQSQVEARRVRLAIERRRIRRCGAHRGGWGRGGGMDAVGAGSIAAGASASAGRCICFASAAKVTSRAVRLST